MALVHPLLLEGQCSSLQGWRMNLYERLRKMKIVLIEDDPGIRNGLRTFFRYQGCRLQDFGNATLAMEALTKEKVDIIISDYWLPDMDGLTLLQQVRTRQPEAIRILITAYPTASTREEAARTGIHDYIEKPLTVQKLEKSLESLIAKSSSGKEGFF